MVTLLVLTLTTCFEALAQEVVAALELGGTHVELVAHRSDKPGYFFYNMHDNENTGVEATAKQVRKRGGVLYELKHTGERYIEFDCDSLHYMIDPNRIYTDTGICRELDRSAVRDTVVFDMVRSFAELLISLMKLDDQQLVLTLHNNTDDNYYMLSYVPGAVYETDAEAVYNGKHKDPDQFYFVTSARLYGLLTPTKFNVVVQNNANVTDDGSLSVYCGQRGIEYVNVEAQHGKKWVNRSMVRRMLKALEGQR